MRAMASPPPPSQAEEMRSGPLFHQMDVTRGLSRKHVGMIDKVPYENVLNGVFCYRGRTLAGANVRDFVLRGM